MDPDFRDYVVASSPALLRTAYLLTGDREDAEDLLQEALFRLSRVWRRVSGSQSLDAYVRRTMVNLRTSRWRRRRIQTVAVDSVESVSKQSAGDGVAERLSDRDELWSALAAIPPRMRAVLVLRFYEDMSEAETAALLECSIGTVKSQTSRALAKLRKTMPERTFQC